MAQWAIGHWLTSIAMSMIVKIVQTAIVARIIALSEKPEYHKYIYICISLVYLVKCRTSHAVESQDEESHEDSLGGE